MLASTSEGQPQFCRIDAAYRLPYPLIKGGREIRLVVSLDLLVLRVALLLDLLYRAEVLTVI